LSGPPPKYLWAGCLINIATGTLTSLFAGIVLSPTITKSIFSALAMFSNSERSLVNEVVYKQILVPAVDSKIQQTRDTKARAIAQHLKDDDLTTYPLSVLSTTLWITTTVARLWKVYAWRWQMACKTQQTRKSTP
jgi:hypothetical protein